MKTLPPKFVAILLAGGSGLRFGSPMPKQLHKMGGKEVYLYTLKIFLEMNRFAKIILPVSPQWKKQVEKQVASLYPNHPIEIITGGSSRQHSCFLALQECPPDTGYVVIHDAVRPFVSSEIIERNIDAVMMHKAVDTCIPSADTLVHSKDGKFIDVIPQRSEFLRGQTPQSFSFPLLMQAHKTAFLKQITDSPDDCKLVRDLGYSVYVVPGDEQNLKITTSFDLFLAEQILYHPQEKPTSLEKLSLQNAIFAITGASGGIGKAICHKLQALGATTVEISKTSSPFQADLTCYSEVKQVFQKIEQIYGPLDGLINSVGSFQVKPFDLLSQEEIQHTINTNLLSTIYCCKCALIKKNGHIINISSSSYSRGRKDYPIYSASKAAVVNFTQGLAEIRSDLFINVAVPQRAATLLRKANYPLEDELSLLHPDEIAEQISNILTSPPITGSIIDIRKEFKKESALVN